MSKRVFQFELQSTNLVKVTDSNCDEVLLYNNGTWRNLVFNKSTGFWELHLDDKEVEKVQEDTGYKIMVIDDGVGVFSDFKMLYVPVLEDSYGFSDVTIYNKEVKVVINGVISNTKKKKARFTEAEKQALRQRIEGGAVNNG